jgi:hypothetical protein
MGHRTGRIHPSRRQIKDARPNKYGRPWRRTCGRRSRQARGRADEPAESSSSKLAGLLLRSSRHRATGCLGFCCRADPTRHHPAAIDCPHTSARASRPVPADGDRQQATMSSRLIARLLRQKKERDKCPPFKLTTRSSERSHRWPRSVSLHDSLLETLTTSSTLSRLLLAY